MVKGGEVEENEAEGREKRIRQKEDMTLKGQ
jgi:hypothetical protein